MSDCGVCIGGGDYDGSLEFYDSRVIVARKSHKCEECGREIPSGQQYEYVSGKFDGDFFYVKTCMDCVDIRDGLTCNGGSIAHGQLWGELRDYGFQNMTMGCLTKLKTASAKSYLVQRWNQWKGLAS